MGDDHGTTGELQKSIFQRTKGFDVQVVGRFVKEQQVTALLERQCQVQTVALTTGQNTSRLLLVRTLEAERGHVSARRHFNVSDLDIVESVRDDLPEGLIRINAGTSLVNVRDFDGFTDIQFATVKRLQANDGLEQGRLTNTVGTNDADNAVTRQGERQSIDQRAIAEALL